jgi:hypothetical protein
LITIFAPTGALPPVAPPCPPEPPVAPPLPPLAPPEALVVVVDAVVGVVVVVVPPCPPALAPPAAVVEPVSVAVGVVAVDDVPPVSVAPPAPPDSELAQAAPVARKSQINAFLDMGAPRSRRVKAPVGAFELSAGAKGPELGDAWIGAAGGGRRERSSLWSTLLERGFEQSGSQRGPALVAERPGHETRSHDGE